MVVTLSVQDEMTPVLRRITRQVWIMEHAEGVYRAMMVLLFVVGFLLGRLI